MNNPETISAIKLERYREPPAIVFAKQEATHRSHERNISRANALESIARERGWSNWNMMRNAMSRPGIPFPRNSEVERAIHCQLMLHPQKPDNVITYLLEGVPSEADCSADWRQREIQTIEGIAQAVFSIHARHNVQVSADTLAACFVDLPTLIKVAIAAPGQKPDFDILACLSRHLFMIVFEDCLNGQPIPAKALELNGLMAMGTSKRLRHAISSGRGF